MATWQELVAEFALEVEESFDELKAALGARLGYGDPLQIVPYRGFGTRERVFVRGRVLENEDVQPARDNDTVWDNLLNMWRRFESDEVPGARVAVRFAGQQTTVVADEEGFFETWLEPAAPLPVERLWHDVDYELLQPETGSAEPVQASGEVLVPPLGAMFAVISDIDDTIVRSEVTSLLRMARIVFLGNARTRLPFSGVSAFYRALQAGAPGDAMNPLFFVSSGPWNMYDLLVDFFRLQDIPRGPLMLRDWGLAAGEALPGRHAGHKLPVIRRILDTYPKLPFILIGDSTQEDPEIYRQIVDLYPERILTIYIRDVTGDEVRADSIQALAAEVVQAGSTLVLAPDTVAAAEHAAEQGWISTQALPAIHDAKAADEPGLAPVEDLVAESRVDLSEEAQTVADGDDGDADSLRFG